MEEASSRKAEPLIWERREDGAPLPLSSPLRSLLLRHNLASQHSVAQASTIQEQGPGEEYQQLGFQTSHSLEWFTLSPDTLVKCLIDSELYILRSGPIDDIDFETVLTAEAFAVNPEEITCSDFHSEGLLQTVDSAVAEGVRQRSMIRRVIKDMLERRHGVTNIVLEEAESILDNEIRERGIKVPEKWNPKSLAIKACVVAKDRLIAQLKRKPRIESEEFHIVLQSIVGANCGSIRRADLFLSYEMPFYNFLSILREETALACKPIPRSDETRGWTLDDGPWMYRLAQTSGTLGDWLDLSDDVKYQEILQSVRNREGDLVVMHKVEVDMVARNQKDEDKIREDWDSERSKDRLIDQHGNIVVFDCGRTEDFLHLFSIGP